MTDDKDAGPRVLGLWTMEAPPRFVGYLKSFDPDARAPGRPFPTGSVAVTKDPDQAMRFASFAVAFETWRTQSTKVPKRPDGEPNRPLTAFSADIQTLQAAKESTNG
jgi:hypothetical protein